TLVADLHDRGMLDETLLVVMGEFGRTPKIGQITSGAGANKDDGRDRLFPAWHRPRDGAARSVRQAVPVEYRYADPHVDRLIPYQFLHDRVGVVVL
ncbi:MAG: DUF1501 domain-containing protein, partial [Planctomycetia bacterium]|nr:DUF1501 domain-containing protein [Planctomycetia bacterium]